MVYLDDLFDRKELHEAWVDGLIRVQLHPDMSLMIFNYTKKTQTNHIWNDVTKKCRGLVMNVDTEEIIARPFEKFFNLGEESVANRLWSDREPVIVTDKLDGSLGISYRGSDGELYIATRGSFTSVQAVKANEILRDKYRYWTPVEDLTYLFEIIYPDNRIVVDYADQEDLVLLGAVNKNTGESVDLEIARLGWDGPSARVFPYASLKEALEAAPRPNAEGLVVHFLWSDQRIKLKQEDYVVLHRIVSNLDERVVWEWLKDGVNVAEMAATLPEEFEDWINQTADRIAGEFLNVYEGIKDYYSYIKDVMGLDPVNPRKHFAETVNITIELAIRPAFFALLDGDTDRVHRVIWKYIRPESVKARTSVKESTNDE